MADLKVTWKLISPEGRLIEKLAGKPARLEDGHSLRCEELVYNRLGYGSFHIAINNVTGTANMDEGLTRFEYTIVVEGSSLQDIETVRQRLKEAVHVNVIAA